MNGATATRDPRAHGRPTSAPPISRCLVICGPTAAGKTPLVLALAAELDVLAISADSRQIYRGFDIGTAKPTASERARVPHACLDLVDPTARFTAYAWAAAAERGMRDAPAMGRLPIVVGGAGFYVRALVHPVTPGAPTGSARHEAHYLVLDPGPVLRQRIAARIGAMLRAGWADEVAALARSVPEDAPAWQGCGYLAMRSYVLGRATRSAAVDRVTIATRQYAKRQRTWFRHQLPSAHVTRLNPDAPDATARALAWVRSLTGSALGS